MSVPISQLIPPHSLEPQIVIIHFPEASLHTCWFSTTPTNVAEKAIAPTPVLLPGKSPWMEALGRLQSMGSRRFGHDWSDLAAAAVNVRITWEDFLQARHLYPTPWFWFNWVDVRSVAWWVFKYLQVIWMGVGVKNLCWNSIVWTIPQCVETDPSAQRQKWARGCARTQMLPNFLHTRGIWLNQALDLLIYLLILRVYILLKWFLNWEY